MDHRGRRDGWAAWGLVLAAALPTAVTIGLGWLAFSGSWDSLPARSRATTGRELLGYRWSDFWFTSSPAITTLLLSSLLPLMLLAVATVMDRPHFLVPTGSGRKAATTVGVVTTFLGLTELAGFSGQLTGLLPVSWKDFFSSELVAFAPFAAVAFSSTVLSAVVTVVLWPRADKEPAQEAPTDSAVEAAIAGEAIAARAVQPIPASGAVTFHPEPSQPGPLQPETPSAMPTPTAADLERYRR